MVSVHGRVPHYVEYTANQSIDYSKGGGRSKIPSHPLLAKNDPNLSPDIPDTSGRRLVSQLNSGLDHIYPQ